MSASHYRVILSPEAISMFAEHISFLARVNKNAAEELRREFIAQAESLEQMPQRYPWLEGEYIPD